MAVQNRPVHLRRRGCANWDDELGCSCIRPPATATEHASPPVPAAAVATEHVSPPSVPAAAPMPTVGTASNVLRHKIRRNCPNWDAELGCLCEAAPSSEPGGSAADGSRAVFIATTTVTHEPQSSTVPTPPPQQGVQPTQQRLPTPPSTQIVRTAFKSPPPPPPAVFPRKPGGSADCHGVVETDGASTINAVLGKESAESTVGAAQYEVGMPLVQATVAERCERSNVALPPPTPNAATSNDGQSDCRNNSSSAPSVLPSEAKQENASLTGGPQIEGLEVEQKKASRDGLSASNSATKVGINDDCRIHHSTAVEACKDAAACSSGSDVAAQKGEMSKSFTAAAAAAAAAWARGAVAAAGARTASSRAAVAAPEACSTSETLTEPRSLVASTVPTASIPTAEATVGPVVPAVVGVQQMPSDVAQADTSVSSAASVVSTVPATSVPFAESVGQCAPVAPVTLADASAPVLQESSAAMEAEVEEPPNKKQRSRSRRRRSERPAVKEASRAQTGLRIVSDLASPDVGWKYPVSDEARRCFVGHLPRALDEVAAKRLMDAALGSPLWCRLEGNSGPVARQTLWTVREPCSCIYRYGGLQVQPGEFPPWVDEAMQICMPLCGLTDKDFWPDSCNLNLYEDGRDSLAWHADDEPLFTVPGKQSDCLIISLSLGANRNFCLKSRSSPRDEFTVRLGAGDLCTMEGLTQKHYVHCVPRDYGRNTGPRVNMTWRWIRQHSPPCIMAEQGDEETATTGGDGRFPRQGRKSERSYGQKGGERRPKRSAHDRSYPEDPSHRHKRWR
eukprot:TRINITY_DN23179_c0_g1_i1.p1 TRINITY_DN23179_c0_g1~~TRINITY_DN23179_c0_g1_i1.p1  ORF type:complete len:792 (+),score=118.19 TRINITY_DN23179_c0_g1_i1:94-2469(+)